MFRITFLLLVFISSITYAQAQEKQKAYKFFEFEKISDNLLLEKNEVFCKEAVKLSWIGWIINYGKPKVASKREIQVRDSLDKCYKDHHDQVRLLFIIVTDSREKPKTVFWVVPPGDEPPKEELPKS